MSVFRPRHNLAVSLRRDMRLLLPSDPGPQRLLEFVHLFNQNATLSAGGRIDIDGWQERYLGTPVPISRDTADEAGIPPGLGVACFVENHAKTRQPGMPGESPQSRKHYEGSVRLLHGLAIRMGGSAWPEAAALNDLLRVVVYTPNPDIGADEAYLLLARYAPDLQPFPRGELAGTGVSAWRTPDGGFEGEFWPAGTTSRMVPPVPRAVADLQFYRASLVAVLLRFPVPGRRCLPANARVLAQCALDLAAAVGGVCVDQLGFRVLRPDDLVFG
jgi:hypothetical protein